MLRELLTNRAKPLARFVGLFSPAELRDAKYFLAQMEAAEQQHSDGVREPGSEPEGVTITIGEEWREPLARSAELLGIPEGEYASFMMKLGQVAFNRKFQRGLSNEQGWWLIEMHSKYPDTFNTSSWEGSCGGLAIDKLYAERGVPVGKYQEWDALRVAKVADTPIGEAVA